MDEKQKKLRAQLASLGSAQAAERLIDMYPLESVDFSEGLLLIPHLSWRKSDQKNWLDTFLKSYLLPVPEGMRLLHRLCL